MNRKKLSTKNIYELVLFLLFIAVTAVLEIPFIYQVAILVAVIGIYKFTEHLIESKKVKNTAEAAYTEQTGVFPVDKQGEENDEQI